MAGCHVKPEQMFNLIFGYNAPYFEAGVIYSAAAGYNEIVFSTVPSGQLRIVRSVAAKDAITGGGYINFYIYYIATSFPITDSLVGGANLWRGVKVDVVLPAGALLYCTWSGAVAGDLLEFRATGYNMKLTQ